MKHTFFHVFLDKKSKDLLIVECDVFFSVKILCPILFQISFIRIKYTFLKYINLIMGGHLSKGCKIIYVMIY